MIVMGTMPSRLLPAIGLAAALAACAPPSMVPVVTVPLSRPDAQPALAGAPVAAAPTAPMSDMELLASRQLVLPVAGIPGDRIQDSFTHARDGGARVHGAIDIMAPRGTPILAADDGRVLRMSSSALGGITLYATDLDEIFVYYYAHLDGYHPLMAQGRPLSRGDTIGFVGTTGNASGGPPHLHFQIMRMPADGRYWMGEPINPYPILRGTTPGRRDD
jgi:peptidoglycan LD-endopeptidase LytH